MGNQQSKHTAESLLREKLIIDRLQAISIRDRTSDDEDYVCVDSEEKRTMKYVSENPSLSTSAVEKWQHELLQDPKNRSVSLR